MKTVAVLLPFFNASRFLGACIESVLTQTFGDFELILCDDGSSDDSRILAGEYAARDRRIKLLVNPRNLGIAATRNRLLSEVAAETEFIALMDADDVCFPDRLARQTAFLREHKDIAAVGAALEIIDENGQKTGFRTYPLAPAILRKTILKNNPFSQSSLMLRRTVFDTIGQYNECCIAASDYEYWLRALKKFDFANLPDPVIRYRISSTQIKQKHLKETLRTTLRLQRKHLFAREYRSFGALIHHCAGYFLLMLPGGMVLLLFKLLTYGTGKK